jgi:KDO2-lipid IV(A) lauroyltransferase
LKKSSAPDETPPLPVLHYVYRLLSLCSLRCLFRLARLVGFVVQRTRNQISAQTRENIDLCFPSLSESQRHQLAGESIVHTCCAFLELAAAWYHPIATSLAKVEIAHLDEGFHDSGRSKIVVVPHQGSWEMMSYWLGQQGPTYALYKPARRKPMDNFIFRQRSRNGVRMVPTSTSGLRHLLAGLKKNATCMVLPDQRPAEKTGWVDSSFFKQQAKTSLLIKNLAQRV